MNTCGIQRLHVDVVVLSRPDMVPPPAVVEAIQGQRDVEIDLHFHQGQPRITDRNRWQTIARARNEMKHLGHASWVMFVDDDVLLSSDCVCTLARTLQASPRLGAVAADYDHECMHPQWDGHVTLGACLFRRETLQRLSFRSTDRLCECWCCCKDLRRKGIGITYCPTATATHLGKQSNRLKRQRNLEVPRELAVNCAGLEQIRNARVLAAFDRRDVTRFEHQFLHTLRAWGNDEIVMAVGYGLYPSELRRLERLRNVQVVPRLANRVMVPIRRLQDFAEVTASLPPHTPVAYWDVADVVFQTSLQSLWREVESHPGKLLAVAEPKGFPENRVIIPWTQSIHDPYHRRNALDLLAAYSFLNSGFAAGTAEVMHHYFKEAHRMRFGPELNGSTDWGDQMCLNLYCHQDPTRWYEVDEGWNFCILDRYMGEITVNSSGLVVSRRYGQVPIAHGNARSLRQLSLLVH